MFLAFVPWYADLTVRFIHRVGLALTSQLQIAGHVLGAAAALAPAVQAFETDPPLRRVGPLASREKRGLSSREPFRGRFV